MQSNPTGDSTLADGAVAFVNYRILTQSASVAVSQLTNPQDPYQARAMRIVQSNATAQRFGLCQTIINQDCQDLRTLQINAFHRARFSTTGRTMFALLEWDGAADESPSDPINDWTSAAYIPGQFFVSTVRVLNVGYLSAIENAWATAPYIPYIGTNSLSNLIYVVWTENEAAQNVRLDLGLWQLAEGSEQQSFEHRPYALTQAISTPTTIIRDIPDLRAQTWTSPPVIVWLINSHHAGDGGGEFRLDASDTTTADDNGIVIVTADGWRYKRQDNGEIDLAWFGLADGGLWDTPWASATAALSATRKSIVIRPGLYDSVAGFTYADGSDTQQASAKYHGVSVRILAGGGGLGPGFAAGGRNIVRIRYTGALNNSLALFTIAGPLVEVTFDRKIFLDANDLAGYCVNIIHTTESQFSFHCENYRVRIGTAQARDVVYSGPASTPWGMTDNVFDITSAEPSLGSTSGFLLKGGYVNNIAFSRNRGTIASVYGGDAGTYGISQDFTDNNPDLYFYTNSFASPNNGDSMIYITHATGSNAGLFPLENVNQGPLIGGVPKYITDAGAPSTVGGKNGLPWYATGDGEVVPNDERLKGWTFDGVLFGYWAGVAVPMSGKSDPGTGLTSARLYYPPYGVSVGNASDFYLAIIGPASRIHGFIVRLDGVPGVGTSRTFTVNKNGVATALTITFGAAESGVKTVQVTGGVSFARGDYVSIDSNVSGAPANTNASWSFVAYPSEVV